MSLKERDRERKREMRLFEALHKVLQRIREYEPTTYLKFRDVHPLYCPLANEQHEESGRQYMHVWCAGIDLPPGGNGDVICVARAAGRLPMENLLGLFAHEMGHLISNSQNQDVADETMRRFGIEIEYDQNTVQMAWW